MATPLMRRRGRGLDVLLVLAACALAIGMAELAVRAIAPQDLTTSYLVQNANGLWLNKSSGSARHQVGAFEARYRFFPGHLRDSQRMPGRTNVLVLGDSFTFGWLLPKEQTYVDRIQRQADERFGPRFGFMNAAVGGMGTAEQLAFLQDEADAVRPDAIVLFLSIHDADRVALTRQFDYAADSGALVRTPQPPSAAKRALNALPGYDWLLGHSHVVQLVRRCASGACGRVRSESFEWMPESAAVDDSRDLRKTLAVLEAIRDWSASRGAPLLVLSNGWPTPRTSPATRALYRSAPTLLAERGIRYCDTRDGFAESIRADVARLQIPDDFHPNAEGARLIADNAWARCLHGFLDAVGTGSRASR